ncbi:hypothetical protein EVAR_56668_1 [Eumeta japonica]|uniref:Uncharacterized protein n=1 Tax=Eumeta variegata TaxID=151549 RepID=A0A4C1YX12_EUMVA|nr:hypothetical protein EVAR_56668_1 [Eumeta japonica]
MLSSVCDRFSRSEARLLSNINFCFMSHSLGRRCPRRPGAGGHRRLKKLSGRFTVTTTFTIEPPSLLAEDTARDPRFE